MARTTKSALIAKPRSAVKKKSAAGRDQRKAAPSAAEPQAYAGVSSAAVEKATGKPWSHWLAVLDKADARHLPHKDIAELLLGRHNVPPWWSQMITVGYEQARGLRVKHQTARGFSVSASRTIAADINVVFRAWTESKVREKWLEGAPVSIRKATPGKSIRPNWTDPAARNGREPRQRIIEVILVDKSAPGKAKTAVQVQEGKLASASEVTKRKTYWAKALDRLRSQLEA